MLTGLLLCVTAAISIWKIVIDFQTHSRREIDIRDCRYDDNSGNHAALPTFFGLSVVPKILLVLLQLATAFDFFHGAKLSLQNMINEDEQYFWRTAWVCFFVFCSCITTIFEFVFVFNTICPSCCLRHGMVRRYILWNAPGIALVVSLALASVACFLFVLLVAAYLLAEKVVLACIGFAHLLCRSLANKKDVAEDQQVVCLSTAI